MRFDPRTTPARPDVAAHHLQGQVEAARFEAGEVMHVVAPVLDLFTSTEPDASLASQLLFGEEFTLYDRGTGGQVWGQAGEDGYVGYVDGAGLLPGTSAANARVCVRSTHLYPTQSVKSRPSIWIPFLARLDSDLSMSEFSSVEVDRFCPSLHLQPVDARQADYVSTAEMFLGSPYLWGGKTVLGIDCSGLVQVALQAACIKAPRDSDMQAELGREIDEKSALRRGDLVFWKGHVGMMQDAATLFHANAHAMAVTAEPLSKAEARIKANGYGEIIARRRILAED